MAHRFSLCATLPRISAASSFLACLEVWHRAAAARRSGRPQRCRKIGRCCSLSPGEHELDAGQRFPAAAHHVLSVRRSPAGSGLPCRLGSPAFPRPRPTSGPASGAPLLRDGPWLPSARWTGCRAARSSGWRGRVSVAGRRPLSHEPDQSSRPASSRLLEGEPAGWPGALVRRHHDDRSSRGLARPACGARPRPAATRSTAG